MKKLFLGLLTLAAGSTVLPTAVDDAIAGGFPGVDTLFAELNGVKGELAGAVVAFNEQKAKFGKFAGYFQTIKTNREAAFECIRLQFASFSEALEDCLRKKEISTSSINADKRLLNGQLTDLRKCTQLEIDRLNEDISLLNEKIDTIERDYATLSNMSLEKVNAAIAELTSIKDSYSDMVVVREGFLSELNTLLDNLNASDVSEKNATQLLKSEFCHDVVILPIEEPILIDGSSSNS